MVAWFLDEEVIWLAENHLDDFNNIDRNASTEYKGESIPALRGFLFKITDEFAKKFPYRYYETPLNDIPEELRKRQVKDAAEWSKLPEKFCHRLQYLKTHGLPERASTTTGSREGTAQTEATEIRSASESAITHSQQSDGEESLEDVDFVPQDIDDATEWTDDEDVPEDATGSSVPVQDPTEPLSRVPKGKVDKGPHEDAERWDSYRPSDAQTFRWQDIANDLNVYESASWAECSPEDLHARQARLPHVVRELCNLISYGTGCELYATGVVAMRNNIYSFDTTGTRSQSYLRSDASRSSRARFSEFAATYLGPALCTNLDCPEPAVIGDLNCDNRPILPSPPPVLEQEQRNLHELFTATLRWQGGVNQVPYSLIEQQAGRGVYDIVSKEVYPDGVTAFKSPNRMSDIETRKWTEHIRAGDRQSLPADRRFQFRLPRPNQSVTTFQTVGTGRARVFFNPAARAYAQRLNGLTTYSLTPRSDQLPQFSSDEKPYLSLTDDDHFGLISALQEYPQCVAMLNALRAFDESFPVHATRKVWDLRIPGCPHLKPQWPAPSASIEHVVADGGWLPPETFDISHPDHFSKCLTRLFGWCHPRTIPHKLSGTVFGGQGGVKWPALMLCHVQLNMLSLRSNWGEAAEYYGDLASTGRVVFLERDIEQLDTAIQSLSQALLESTAILRDCYDQRRIVTPATRLAEVTQVAHKGFAPGVLQLTEHETFNDVEDWEDAILAAQTEAMDIDKEHDAEEAVAERATQSNSKSPEPLALPRSRRKKGKQPATPRRHSPRKGKAAARVSFIPDAADTNAAGQSTAGTSKASKSSTPRSKSRSGRQPKLPSKRRQELFVDMSTSRT